MLRILAIIFLVNFIFLSSIEAQVTVFPYNEGFESSFTTGINVEFIPDWTGNEVATSNRIFRDGTNQRTGNGSLAVIPISSFTAQIIVDLNFSNLSNAIADFYSRSVQNSTGTRPALVHFSVSADGGNTYTTPVLIGSNVAFPNATTPYFNYTYQFPSITDGASNVKLKITVAQSPDSTGTTARFVMDDFSITGTPFTDTIPPSIVSVTVLSANQLDVKFSEQVSATSAQNIANYSVNNSIGIPQTAIISGTDASLVQLTFSSSFSPGVLYELTVNNVEDLNGNSLVNGVATFGIFTVQSGDVVINEILADPDPPVGLPNFEYLELFNSTYTPIDLLGWTITIGSTVRTFPSVTIEPDSFLLIGTAAAIADLQVYGPTAEVFTSSTTLTNSGTVLTLKNDQGLVIDSLSYNINWYKDSNKDDGGWSLERIDPDFLCPNDGNWTSSNDPSGGTPGKTNSVNGIFTDAEPPRLVRAAVVDSLTISLTFSEPMDTASILNTSLYFINNGIGTPANVSLNTGGEIVILQLAQQIVAGTIYTVTVGSTVKDCSGNLITDAHSARFGLPETAQPLDIIINEILFNPYTGGSDFVELHNRSNKIIDLYGLKIANEDAIGALSTITQITLESYLFFPYDYVVLTPSPDNIRNNYYTPNPDNFINVSLPGYSNSNGVVVLLTPNQETLDRFSYTEDMHFPLLTDVKGVALERINPERPTQETTNWHSASQNSGFATPGYRNSQYSDSQPGTSEMSIDPEIFSPDNDGYNDVANIHFNFESQGFVATVTIYDSRGRLIRKLAQNLLLGTSENTLSWDGINEKNEKAPIGVYVVLAEAFNATGDTKKFKKTVVLATRFN